MRDCVLPEVPLPGQGAGRPMEGHGMPMRSAEDLRLLRHHPRETIRQEALPRDRLHEEDREMPVVPRRHGRDQRLRQRQHRVNLFEF